MRFTRSQLLASVGVVPVGALALHRLAWGAQGGAHGERYAHAHGYLDLATPVALALAPLMLAAALLIPLLAGSERIRRPRPLAHGIWLGLAILLAFGGQELIEGALAHGGVTHAIESLARLLPAALPLAVAIGFAGALIVEALARGAEAVGAGARAQLHPVPRPPIRSACASAPRFSRASTPLAFGLARRPPPAAA